MFALEQPSMALNDNRVPARTMAINRAVTPDEGISSILGAVVDAAKGTPEGKLKNLVINCHGTPGELQLGVGVTKSLTDRFKMLAPGNNPLVGTIYIVACLVARIDGPGSYTDGNLFCSAIAKNAKCQVVASTAEQTIGGPPTPWGHLDRFEGTVLVYGPEGNVLSTYTNPLFDAWSLKSQQ
ncbi:MAG: hypothetical protein ACT4O9_00350 [Blastocatellia bacterium]